MKSFQQASFNPISSDLSLGAAIADISQGWDGTLWAIDTNGAPHTYDPLQGVWNAQGTGIDAAALVGTSTYHFRGPEVVEVTFGTNETGTPTLISDKWPGLPPSFQLGVHGAANVNGTLYLFGRGQYVSVDQPGEVLALDQLKGWPTGGGWAGGAIDGACSLNGDQVLLVRNGEYITISISQRAVLTNPSPLSEYSPFHGVPAQFLEQGFTGGYFFGPNNDNSKVTIYNGPGLLSYVIVDPVPSTQYVAAVYSNWPKNWNPRLAHAPSGRVGNLWSAMADGKGVVYHDGDQWNAISGEATYASVGSDGSVYTVGKGTALYQWQGGENWNQISSPPSGSTLTQISVGDSNHIWARDGGNKVYALAGNAFSPSSEVGQAVHLAANYDGSVWHCNNDASAYRYAGSGSASQALSIPQGTVTKVASTGFGTSHCLTTGSGGSGGALYEYTSPFAYKSAPDYNLGFNTTGQIAAGAGCIFFVHQEGDYSVQSPHFQTYIVATDSQNGQLRWKTPVPWPNCWSSAPTYDPRLNRVYFGMAVKDPNDGTSPGSMVALDARTGEVVWYVEQRAESHPGLITSVDYAPVVWGNLLIFGDRAGYLHAINTDAAVPKGSAQWSIIGAQGHDSGNLRVSTPVIDDGVCYFYTWSSSDSAFYVQTCAAADGSGLSVPPLRTLYTSKGVTPTLWPPLLGRAAFPAGGGPALFVQAGNITHAVNLSVGPDNGGVNADLNVYLNPPNIFTSNLVYRNGTLWVGDTQGQIHALNSAFQHVCSTPQQVAPAGTAFWNISAYDDASGNTTVFCAGGWLAEKPAPSLFAFDPANTVVEEIPTGATLVWELGPISNGVLPAAGGDWGTKGQKGTIFGVRVDQVLATQRAFIVESQLLQDYNPPSGAAQSVATTQARYQTHLTVVDDLKTPRPQQTVKIWAGEPGTTILVNGESFTVGPDDSSFASVQTGPDGMVSIVTDASDLSAVPLYIWSGFMDPYERVVVYPDREFHDRLMTAHANAADDDPDKVNLATATSYDNKPLFTSQEQQTQTPSQVAGAIQQMGGASGLNGSGVRTSGVRLAASAAKYTAYADLVGQHYFPFNVPASRPAAVANALGLSFIGEEGSGLSFSSAAEAALAIDALPGQVWTSDTAIAGAPLLGGWFSDFWDWIKKNIDGVVNKITHIIVSVAEEVYVGIRLIVNGVAKVFRAIIHTIEDVCKTIGAFFIKLGKLIVRVVEALSIFFHWDKIIQVHNALKQTMQGLLNSTSADMAAAVGVVQTFFSSFEQALKDDINKLCGDSQKQAGVTQNRQDPNAHTAFKVKGKSHAVQGMYMWNKTAANGSSATETSSVALAATGDDPTWDLVNAIAAAAKNLGHDFQQIGSDLSNTLKATSAKQLAGDLLKTLLDIIDLVIDVILDTSEGMAVACLQSLSMLVSAFNSLLTTPIDIPFVSWIYTEFISPGNPLTILDLFCLVIAIPIAFVGYAVMGAYPFEAAKASGPPLASDPENRLALQISQGIGFIFQGFFVACSDFLGAVNEVGFWAKKGVSTLVAGCQALTAEIGMCLLPMKNNKPDWSANPLATTNAAVGLVPFAMNVTGIIIVGNPAEGAAQKATNFLIKAITSVLVSLAGLGRLSIVAYDWATAKDPFNATYVATQVGNLLATVPLLLRPMTLAIKADKEPVEQAVLLVVLVYADCIGFCGKGIIELVLAAISTSEKQVGLRRAAGAAAGWGMLPAPAV